MTLSNISLRRALLLVIVTMAVLFGVYLFFTHSYIEVVVPGDGGHTVFTQRQGSTKGSSFVLKSAKTKHLVRRGAYEVLVKKGDESHFSVVKAGGFLKKKTINVNIQPEHARTFVGDNPDPCMHFTGQVLISFTCDGVIDDAHLHKPATIETPGYIVQATGWNIGGTVESVVRTKAGVFALNQPELDEETGEIPQSIYTVLADGSLGDAFNLKGTDASQNYVIKSYSEGFVLFNTVSGQTYYYSSPAAEPSLIEFGQPKNKKLQPYAVEAEGTSILMAYTESGDELNLDEPEAGNIATEFIVKMGGELKRFDLKKQYVSLRFCGTKKLCAIFEKKMDVYDIAGKKAKLVFSVEGVEAAEVVSKIVVATTDNGLLNLDVDKQAGFFSYSLGDYKTCGSYPQETGYMLCLITNKQTKVAIYVDYKNKNTDNIDKKINKLLSFSEIERLTIYGNYIFISPDVGPLVFNESTRSYEYDSVSLKKVNAKVAEDIKVSGIDTGVYKITNLTE